MSRVNSDILHGEQAEIARKESSLQAELKVLRVERDQSIKRRWQSQTPQRTTPAAQVQPPRLIPGKLYDPTVQAAPKVAATTGDDDSVKEAKAELLTWDKIVKSLVGDSSKAAARQRAEAEEQIRELQKQITKHKPLTEQVATLQALVWWHSSSRRRREQRNG